MSDPKQPTNQPSLKGSRLFADPDKIRFQQLYKYVSVDMQKMAQSARNYKGSLGYIGGVLGAMLVYKLFLDSAANYHIFGTNGNGGPFLTMFTRNNNYDYHYNREFQRMRYLSEEVTGNDKANQTSDEVLTDLGVDVKQQGLNAGVVKKAPHYKYFY